MKKTISFLKYYGIHIATGVILFLLYYLSVRYAGYYVSKLFDIYNFAVITTLVILADTIVSAFCIDRLGFAENKFYYAKAFINWVLGIATSVILFFVAFIVTATWL